jgi:hypothetical protein
VTVKTVLASLAAGFVLGLSGTATAAAPAPAPTLQSVSVTDTDRAEFRAAIASSETLVLVMKEFPAEFAAFETQLLSDAKAGRVTAIDVRNRTSEFVTGIQMQVSKFGKSAPASDIGLLYRRSLAALKALQAVNLQACYAFGEGKGLGPDMVGSLPPDAFKAVESYGAFELRVGIAGRRSGITYAPLIEDDVIPVIELYVSKGGDPNYLVAVGEGKADTMLADERCNGAVLWRESVVAQPDLFIARLMSSD